MLAASKDIIRRWLKEGLEEKARYMIVVYDTIACNDYPVFVSKDQDFYEKYDKLGGNSTQRIMEVYDLNMDIESQLNEFRANHRPPRHEKQIAQAMLKMLYRQ
jgi:hypothetical protein